MTVQIPIVPVFLPFFSSEKRFLFAHGGRGGAKSIACAQVILNRARESKIRVLCAREIQKSIKDSVHILLKDLIEKYGFVDFDVQNSLIVNKITGSEIIFIGLREHNIQSIKSYANIDFCWIEEASAVTQNSLDILTPTIRKKGSQILFSYNRYNELDPVHKLFKRELTESKTKIFIDNDTKKEYRWIEYTGPDALGLYINFDGNPFFPDVLEKERAKDEKDDPELYLHKWLGQPVSQDGYALIPRKLVMEAIGRKDIKDWNYACIGVDPARFGDNNSVIAVREGFKILPLYVFKGIDNMRLVGEVIRRLKEYYNKGYVDCIQVNIDIGMGAGVIDRLRELVELEDVKSENEINFNAQINEVNFGGTDVMPEYFNKAAELWGNMKDALKTMQIPNDQELISELTTRKYTLHSDSKIRLMSKKEMRTKQMPSPDRGDAVALALDTDSYDIDFGDDKIESGRSKSYLDK